MVEKAVEYTQHNITWPSPLKINLGCGRDVKEGWINIDIEEGPRIDVVHDLNLVKIEPLPFPDSSVDEIYASHVMEHIPNLLDLSQELHRVAKPGARMIIRVPYGSSDDAYEDPTHVRQCYVSTFQYLAQPAYWKADYGYRGDWREVVTKLCIRKTHENMKIEDIQHAIMHYRNVVEEMIVDLECVKPIRSQKKIEEKRKIEIVFV
jgi:SAM-dependent methyltransferase